MSSLLAIGKTGLLAAQVGLSTTGHNIANANVAGFSRQVAIQATTTPQNLGVGFVGTGTEVSTIKRYYDDFLNKQLLGAQTQQASLNSYYSQVSQIDNLLADTTAGLSPALQDFFKGVQDANASPSTVASRQALLSAADSLVSRFQGMSERFREINDGVNSEISSSVTEINSFAKQIATLNNQIAGLSSDPSRMPNDLLDQRDHLISQLNQLIKVDVKAGDNNTLTVSFGNGQPLVMNNRNFELAVQPSTINNNELTIGYSVNGNISPLPEKVLTGGSLGGLLEFRAGALKTAQNELGKVAAGLATSFNDQHKLGQDLDGAMGENFFNEIRAAVSYDTKNSSLSTAEVSAVVKDASKLTAYDYSVSFDGTNYVVKSSGGGAPTVIPHPQTEPTMIDGVEYTFTGEPQPGDNYLVRPTANAATDFSVAITDRSKIALASPVVVDTPIANKGSGKLVLSGIDAAYREPGNALTDKVTLTFNVDPADPDNPSITGFPDGVDVVMVGTDGTSTTYPAGTPVPYQEGAKLSFGGMTVALSGKPANGDTFSIAPNTNGVADSTNGALLGGLQDKKILDNGSATFQGSYAQMVNFVGNKTREAQIGSLAADAAVKQATNAQQSVSGVNLDEEASNLIRYQQAYQASGKVMQIASELFDVLVSLGR